MPGSRLTRRDRRTIAAGLADGLGYAEIARRLARPTSTISREVTRNGGRAGYDPDAAHRTTKRRAPTQTRRGNRAAPAPRGNRPRRRTAAGRDPDRHRTTQYVRESARRPAHHRRRRHDRRGAGSAPAGELVVGLKVRRIPRRGRGDPPGADRPATGRTIRRRPRRVVPGIPRQRPAKPPTRRHRPPGSRPSRPHHTGRRPSPRAEPIPPTAHQRHHRPGPSLATRTHRTTPRLIAHPHMRVSGVGSGHPYQSTGRKYRRPGREALAAATAITNDSSRGDRVDRLGPVPACRPVAGGVDRRHRRLSAGVHVDRPGPASTRRPAACVEAASCVRDMDARGAAGGSLAATAAARENRGDSPAQSGGSPRCLRCGRRGCGGPPADHAAIGFRRSVSGASSATRSGPRPCLPVCSRRGRWRLSSACPPRLSVLPSPRVLCRCAARLRGL